MTEHQYRSDSEAQPAGVTVGYVYMWNGKPGPARYIPVVSATDGEGRGFIEATGEWAECTVTDG